MFVFGYGSLLRGADGVPCRLRGFRRAWNVAMENRRTIPGYKYYLDEDLGGRVYIYLGRCAARARFELGRRSGRAVAEPLELPARELRQIPVPWSA